jgi:hypothetical protein
LPTAPMRFPAVTWSRTGELSMSHEEPKWYLPGQDQQPTGPFATDDVLARCKVGDVGGATLCWCEGMDGWKPLAEVEPFSGVLAGAAGDAAAQGFDDLGKVFGRAIDFTKRKAKTAALRVTVAKHEKYRQRLLGELGEMLYQRAGDITLLSQEPYAEKLRQIEAEDESLGSLRRQIESMEKAGGAAGQEDNR